MFAYSQPNFLCFLCLALLVPLFYMYVQFYVYVL